MWPIIKKELKNYFLSPIAYIFIGLFLLMSSIFFYIDVYMFSSVGADPISVLTNILAVYTWLG